MIQDSIDVKRQLTSEHISCLNEIVNLLKRCLDEGNKILLFGNGGSAADSQHIAAELVSKFNKDRKALSAIALTTDTSILTSISNDYAFDNVFARQIEALGQKGDVAIGISTSGNSPNVLKGLAVAREKGLSTVGLTGQNGGKLKDYVDICFNAPTNSTARIQEVHITVAHAICDILERELC
ncbi:SIS domain-containing protein [candidate division KSB1 bacterium]|nr:SIS domain-containing protein [candidate division KSB1 bacterium]